MQEAPDENTITTTGPDQESGLLPVKDAERTFGRYELGYELASGGMATIYLARARGPGGFDRPFAIKRIHPHLAKQKDFVAMFLDEARLQSRISHPNVCSVIDFGEVDGTYFMAMEYLLGRPLHVLMKAVVERPELHRSLRWQVLAARMIADACEGLHAAHELKDEHARPMHVVHRDVTPHNLLLTYEGAVKVIDFGVAFSEGRSHETRTGAVKGKFAYMSPEQVRGREIDRRVDVWALGVCLWELLTGRRLYGKRSDVELIHAIVNEPFKPPSMFVPIPAALDTIVMRALERDIDRRTPTARALGRELSTFVAASGLPAGVAELADLMAELDGAERTKRLDVVASLLADPPAIESEPTRAPRRGQGTEDVPTLPPPPAPAPLLAGTATVVPPDLHTAGTVTKVPAVRPQREAASRTEPFAAVAPPKEAPRRAVAIVVMLGVLGLLAVAMALVLASGPGDEQVRVVALPPLATPIVPVAPAQPPVLTAPLVTAAVEAPEPIAAPLYEPTLAQAPSGPSSPEPSVPAPSAERARSTPRGPGTGTLNVAVTGGWASIFIDGVASGTTPRRIELPARRHVVELRREGRLVARRAVSIERNETTRIVVPLQ